MVLPQEAALVMFGAPDHPLVRGSRGRRGSVAPVSRDACAGFSLYVSDAAGEFHSMVRGYFEQEGLPGPRLEASGSIEGVKRAVLADPAALGLLPSYAVALELSAGAFVVVSLQPPLPRVQLEALFPAGRPATPHVAAILDLLTGRTS
jgi:DNA-binding transcriptional LysR family regulator